MNLLFLLFGLGLSWLVGVAWLRVFAHRLDERAPHPAVLTGYGFFWGMAFTAALIVLTASMLGRLSFPAVCLALLILLAPALWLWRRTPAPLPFAVPAAPSSAPAGPWTLRILGALVGLHFLFSAVEIVTQPLFPWDAWTVWVFRAKAWFLQGELFDFVSARDWWSATDPSVYTQPALSYPLVPSLIPLWAAMGLGEWHEALINLPVLFCGLAIALGLFGQLRAVGLGFAAALLAAYLLVSTPLFATHMSLGGYGDIWLAGFAGLGLVGVIRGLCQDRRRALWIGLVMLSVGTQVKKEGFVWLLAGLLLIVLVRAPRRWLAGGAGLLLVLISLAAVTGWTHFEVPGIGVIGVADGALRIPGLGPIPLEKNAVGEAYLRNALFMGSWNLAWLLLGLVSVAALLARSARNRRVPLLFLGIFAATQAAIFGFTAQGAWAEDYTAINRLPLQVYPALLFSLLLLARSISARPGDKGLGRPAHIATGRPRFLLAALLSLATVSVGLVLLLWNEARAVDATPVTVEAGAFRIVAGGGEVVDGRVVIERYADDFALVSSGPVTVDAERLKVLELDLRFEPVLDAPEKAPAFFWRLAEAPERVNRLTLDGRPVVDLARETEWRGTVTEFGFLFLRHDDHPASVANVRLVGNTLRSRLRLLLHEWFSFELWTQRSAHMIYGGAPVQQAWLPLAVGAWVLLTVALLYVFNRGAPGARAVLLVALVGWWTLDARWLLNRARQFQQSATMLFQMDVEQRIAASELGRYYGYVRKVRDELTGADPSRILLLLDPKEPKFYGLRSKYQLLPDSVNVVPTFPPTNALGTLDYVLFLGDFMPEDGDPKRGQVLAERLRALPIGRQSRERLGLVDFSEDGMLFEVRRD